MSAFCASAFGAAEHFLVQGEPRPRRIAIAPVTDDEKMDFGVKRPQPLDATNEVPSWIRLTLPTTKALAGIPSLRRMRGQSARGGTAGSYSNGLLS